MTVKRNLACLHSILGYNIRERILFFRIASDLIPFASHPVCTYPWQDYFSHELQMLGRFIRRNKMRISMHPDQFVLLNSPNELVVKKSIADLVYHTEVLDGMELDHSAKIQIHIGGVYEDKTGSIERFLQNFNRLDPSIRNRLVIENDDRLYSASDCLEVHAKTGVPIIFDVFHHAVNNKGDQVETLLPSIFSSWKAEDGIPMVDYSSQQEGKRRGAHADHIDAEDFRRFLQKTQPYDHDIMLEIKDKEKSAREAIKIAREDPRFYA